MDGIARIVDDVLERCSWSINSLVYHNLLVHIAISLARIEAGCLIPPDDELLAKIKGSRAFEVAVCLASEVEREFGVDLPESEAAYIAIHLMGKQCTSPESVDGKSAADDSIVVDDDVWSAVESMLSVVNKIYRYDFRDDLELRMNLARHIVPLAVRIKYGMQADNPVLGDIRTHYPLAYAMALDSSFVLAEVYGGTLSEDEVGYIALAFALAIERKKTVRERKNILIVCATGHAGAGMLERLYRQQFGMYLNHIYTCDVSNAERFDFTRVDYVFTTVPLDFNPPVMVREVSFFLDDSDVAPVAGLLASDGAGFHVGRSFSERIPDDLFFEQLQAASKSDAIDRMCREMERRADVGSGLRDLVLQREEFVPTAFGNGVAIPHPMEPVCEKMIASVALLDKPIDWNGQEVSLVVLLAISNEEGPEASRFIGALADLCVSPDEIARLLDLRSRDAFLARLDAVSAATA